MDILSHILWTLIAWPKTNYTFLPLIIASIPDLLPFLASLFYFSYKKKLKYFLFTKLDKGIVTKYPKPINFIYHSLHSIIVFAIALIILIILFGLNPLILYFICLPWVFHIFLDIFLHGKKYVSPQFLFPLSKFKLKGINYYTPPLVIINYILLIILLIIKFIT